jgi:hypothetical protein
LRREAEDKRRISELEVEKKLRDLEDKRKEDEQKRVAEIEYIKNNYEKKPGGCNLL